jgi:hypothetical protein
LPFWVFDSISFKNTPLGVLYNALPAANFESIMKKLIILCLFIASALMAKAQSHISTGKWACQLVPKSLGAEKYTCPACAKIAEQKRLAKIEQDKKEYQASVESAKAAKLASIAASKKLAEEREKKNKVTEVHLTMPSSASSGSSSSADNSSAGTTDNSSASTQAATTTSDVTVYNNMFAAANAKKYAEEKAYQDLATGVYNLFAPSPERLAREQKEREYYQRVAAKDFELGQQLIKDNLATALKGDSLSIQNTYNGYLKTGRKETAMELVNKIHQQYRTKATFNILSSIYKAEEEGYKREIESYKFDRRTNRAYTYMVLGGAVAAVPLLFKKQLVAKHGDDAATATYILAGAGGVSILAAVIAKMTIPPLSSKKKYKDAIEGIERIKKTNVQANVSPLYNPANKTPMLGLNIKF